MKKTISVILSICIIICSCATISFATPNYNTEQSYETNEYDIYLQYMSMSDEELIEDGKTCEEIQLIRNFNYEDEIKKRASLSDEILETYGYTDNDIKELRQVASSDNISEAQIRSISDSTLKTYIRVVKYDTYNDVSNGLTRYVLMAYKFKWYRIPFFHYIDTVAIAFNTNDASNQFTFQNIVEGGSIKVNDITDYRLKANLTSLTTSETVEQICDWDYDVKNTNVISAKFSLTLFDINLSPTHMCWSGSGRFRLTYEKANPRLYVDAVYGHSTLSLDPEFSVSLSGVSASIAFKGTVDEQHRTGWFNKDFTISKEYIYNDTYEGVFGYGDTSFKTYL